jgi:hypothetical protein
MEGSEDFGFTGQLGHSNDMNAVKLSATFILLKNSTGCSSIVFSATDTSCWCGRFSGTKIVLILDCNPPV